jgi:hypothetical protein
MPTKWPYSSRHRISLRVPWPRVIVDESWGRYQYQVSIAAVQFDSRHKTTRVRIIERCWRSPPQQKPHARYRAGGWHTIPHARLILQRISKHADDSSASIDSLTLAIRPCWIIIALIVNENRDGNN